MDGLIIVGIAAVALTVVSLLIFGWAASRVWPDGDEKSKGPGHERD